jgi:O-antigen/teichoic acid export membrane protein
MDKKVGRNLLFSGAAWFLPAALAVVAVPVVVHRLGVAAYGVVALAGAVSGYLGVLDLGLGQGVIRYLSVFVSLGHGKAMRHLMAYVLAWFLAVGVLGTAAVWVLSPWLAQSLLKVPPALLQPSITAFRLGGAAFGLGMIVSVLGLVPQAFLRYDVVSALNVVFGALTIGGPAILVLLGYGLVPVMWLSVFAAALACLCWGVAATRLMASVPNDGPPLSEYWRGFLNFSLKNGINRVWSAVQTPTSQVVVGVAGGVTAAGYFQVPMLISSKVTDLLSRLNAVLLPTGSQLVAEEEHDQLLALYERSSRLFYVLNASVVGAVVVFSAPLLGYWMDPGFAVAGGAAFAVLTLAVGLNAVSMTASQMNMALGRPGVNLAFSVANSVINLGTVYFLTVAYGITGTALSGLLAAAVVPSFLHYSHRKILGIGSWRVFRDCYLRTTIAVTAVGCLSWFALRPLASNLLTTIVLVGLAAAIGALASALSGSVTRADWTSLRNALRSSSRAEQPSGPTPRARGGDDDV